MEDDPSKRVPGRGDVSGPSNASGFINGALQIFRLWQVWIVTGICMWAVWKLAPQQLGISIYKASLITSGALLGFWVDKWTFPRISWEQSGDPDMVHGCYRRAGLMAAGMLAFGLGA